MTKTFTLNENADVCGTSLKLRTTVSYPKLLELFGEPLESDGYKVSGEWIFEDDKGNVITLYDWKSTKLYDPDYPSIAELRADSDVELHIGGNDIAIASTFNTWLQKQL